MSTTTKGYTFRSESGLPHYKFVVICSSQKHCILSCDVAWGFFREWDGAYGTHQMTDSMGLPNLRLGSKAIPSMESYYEHDGTESGIRSALERIESELLTYANPWFRSRSEMANGDPLLRHGLGWIKKHFEVIPATFQEDFRRALVNASNNRRRVELPPLDALKKELRHFASKIQVSTWQRKQTGILAEHLLLYASDAKNR